jgi:uncharacterized protein YbjT (DUF2867 family)
MIESMRVAVAGGTGVVGRHVVDVLREAAHDPVVLARSNGVDVVTGDGLDAALEGAAVVVDVCNTTNLSRAKSEAFFETATHNLVAAGQRAGVGHYAVLSIVGCDRVDLGYYHGKRRQEAVALAGSIPASILRATQFHEFPEQLIERAPGGPVIAIPRWKAQPIAAREAAAALVELALGEPTAAVGEIAGPEQHDMPDLVRLVLRSRGSRRAVIGLRLPGATGRSLATGGLVPDGPGPRGRVTFAEWLRSRST